MRRVPAGAGIQGGWAHRGLDPGLEGRRPFARSQGQYMALLLKEWTLFRSHLALVFKQVAVQSRCLPVSKEVAVMLVEAKRGPRGRGWEGQ